MPCNKLADQRQAQSKALMPACRRPINLIETIKNMGQLLGWDADTGIGYPYGYHLIFQSPGDVDTPFRRREFYCIGNNVSDDFFECIRICINPEVTFRLIQIEADPFHRSEMLHRSGRVA